LLLRGSCQVFAVTEQLQVGDSPENCCHPEKRYAGDGQQTNVDFFLLHGPRLPVGAPNPVESVLGTLLRCPVQPCVLERGHFRSVQIHVFPNLVGFGPFEPQFMLRDDVDPVRITQRRDLEL